MATESDAAHGSRVFREAFETTTRIGLALLLLV